MHIEKSPRPLWSSGGLLCAERLVPPLEHRDADGGSVRAVVKEHEPIEWVETVAARFKGVTVQKARVIVCRIIVESDGPFDGPHTVGERDGAKIGRRYLDDVAWLKGLDPGRV